MQPLRILASQVRNQRPPLPAGWSRSSQLGGRCGQLSALMDRDSVRLAVRTFNHRLMKRDHATSPETIALGWLKILLEMPNGVPPRAGLAEPILRHLNPPVTAGRRTRLYQHGSIPGPKRLIPPEIPPPSALLPQRLPRQSSRCDNIPDPYPPERQPPHDHVLLPLIAASIPTKRCLRATQRDYRCAVPPLRPMIGQTSTI